MRRVFDADEVIGENAEVAHLGIRLVVHDLGGDLVVRAVARWVSMTHTQLRRPGLRSSGPPAIAGGPSGMTWVTSGRDFRPCLWRPMRS